MASGSEKELRGRNERVGHQNHSREKVVTAAGTPPFSCFRSFLCSLTSPFPFAAEFEALNYAAALRVGTRKCRIDYVRFICNLNRAMCYGETIYLVPDSLNPTRQRRGGLTPKDKDHGFDREGPEAERSSICGTRRKSIRQLRESVTDPPPM